MATSLRDLHCKLIKPSAKAMGWKETLAPTRLNADISTPEL